MFTFLPYGSDNYFSSDKKASEIGSNKPRRGSACRRGKLIREQLERARTADRSSKKFMRVRRHHSWRTTRPVHYEGFCKIVISIADTGFLVAFAASARRAPRLGGAQLPNELSRTAACVRSRPGETAFQIEERRGRPRNDCPSELVTLSFDLNDHLPQLTALAKRYADRQPDLADLCLIRMSELYPHHRVITADQGFSRLPPEQTRGDSADLPALNPNSPRDESAL